MSTKTNFWPVPEPVSTMAQSPAPKMQLKEGSVLLTMEPTPGSEEQGQLNPVGLAFRSSVFQKLNPNFRAIALS